MKVRLIAAVIGALATLGVLLPVMPAQAAPAVRFTRVYFDSPGADHGSNASLNAEWARVKNFSSRARALTGWTVRDAQGHAYRFPRFILRSGATVTLHTGRGTNTGSNLYWRSSGYVWNNSGDRATLRTPAGTQIDVCSFGGAGSSTGC